MNLTDDGISAEMGLNLSLGQWEVYVTGNKESSRLTTVPIILKVKESGLVDEPLHSIPMSVAEQVDTKASTALLMAQAVKDKADSGEFDGKSFEIKGFFASAEELEAAVTEPGKGDTYGVGASAPYDIYIWDEINSVWVNNGSIQGAKGDKGDAGATFTPNVSANGNLSWTNNGGLENPLTVNIMGAKGDKGDRGAEGKSPYQIASENGYTGTETTFNQSLTAFPYHNARHLPNGADPITVKTGNIEDGAVTRAKLAQDALYSPLTNVEAVTALNSSNIGETFRTTNGSTDYVFNVSKNSQITTGAEYAIIRGYAKSCKVVFGSDVRIGLAGNPTWLTAPTVSVSESFTMIALKKIAVDSAYDYWLVTGNVEVVT